MVTSNIKNKKNIKNIGQLINSNSGIHQKKHVDMSLGAMLKHYITIKLWYFHNWNFSPSYFLLLTYCNAKKTIIEYNFK